MTFDKHFIYICFNNVHNTKEATKNIILRLQHLN